MRLVATTDQIGALSTDQSEALSSAQLAALTSTQISAFATDDILLYGLIAQHRSQSRFKVVGEFLSYDPYGIAFHRNEPDLHDSVERAIRNLVIARDIDAIYAKWFESRLPNGERFNMPMSPQLEESFKVLGEGSEPN